MNLTKKIARLEEELHASAPDKSAAIVKKLVSCKDKQINKKHR